MPTSYLHSIVHPHQSICIYLHCCTFPPPLCLCLPFCLLLLSLTLWFFSGVLWPWPLSFCPLLCFFVPVAGLFCHDCVSAFVSLCPCLHFSVTLFLCVPFVSVSLCLPPHLPTHLCMTTECQQNILIVSTGSGTSNYLGSNPS